MWWVGGWLYVWTVVCSFPHSTHLASAPPSQLGRKNRHTQGLPHHFTSFFRFKSLETSNYSLPGTAHHTRHVVPAPHSHLSRTSSHPNPLRLPSLQNTSLRSYLIDFLCILSSYPLSPDPPFAPLPSHTQTYIHGSEGHLTLPRLPLPRPRQAQPPYLFL